MQRSLMAVVVGTVVACRPGGAPVLEPSSGNLAGYYPVRADLAATELVADDIAEVRIGGIRAYGLAADGADAVTFIVQGAPTAGPQPTELVLDTGETVSFSDVFSYDPPSDPAFERVVAMGASLTQGVQGGVPVAHGVLHSPPHLVAEQLGAYLPQPMLVDPLFPTIGWDAVGPAPECEVPDVVQFIASAALEVLPRLEDENTGLLSFAEARVDPDLEIHNVGVGDTDLASLVHGPPEDPAELFVVKMVYAPDADVVEHVTTSQLELVEALDPTLVMVSDTYGNDLIGSILLGEGLDPERITDEATFRADLEELAERLAATGAEVFLANIPLPTVLPMTDDKRRAAIADGDDPAEFDALAAEIDAIAQRFNDILDEVAAQHDTVHVVDFAGMAADIEAQPLQVGGRELTIGKFGGVLSTDGVHFGDVGYGALANLFLDTIDAELGTDTPRVDLDALYADDPYSPDAALAAGVDPAACW